MDTNDTAMFQQAMNLARSGQRGEAYAQLNAIRLNGNHNNPDLLLWIAFTTPYQAEAQQMIDSAAAIAPNHSALPAARQDFMQRYYPQQCIAPPRPHVIPYGQLGPVLYCPYCHAHAPARIVSRVSTGGWVVFAVLLFFTLIFCWLGLLIRENYYVCSHCGIRLG
jgi:hypothetical protein